MARQKTPDMLEEVEGAADRMAAWIGENAVPVIAGTVLVIALAVAISSYLGRTWFWAFLVAMLLPAAYIHVWWLPSRGVNGWTGEPKDRYYELRGWSTPGEKQ